MGNFLLSLVRITRWKSFWLFLLMLLSALLEGFGLLLLIPLLGIIGIDTVAPATATSHLHHWLMVHHDRLTLPEVLLIYCVLVFFSAWVAYATTRLSQQVQLQFCEKVRNRLYQSLLHSSWAFLRRQKQSNLAHLLTFEIARVSTATNRLLTFLSGLVMVVVYGAMAIALSWQVALIAILLSAVAYLINRVINRRLYQNGQRQHLNWQRLYETVLKHLNGLKLSKSMAAESRHYQQFDQINRAVNHEQLEFVRCTGLARVVYQTMAVVMLSVIFYVAYQGLHTPLSALLVLLLVCARLAPKLNSSHQDFQLLLNMLPAFEAIQATQAAAEAEREAATAVNPPTFLHRLQLDQVSYEHDVETPHAALHQIAWTLTPNRIYALVGPSGAGKSTLMDIVAGLLMPDQGRIVLDGQVCGEAQLKTWRQQVGYCLQEPFLFNGTVRENLIWAKPDASEVDIWQALQWAMADHLVQRLPQGLDTPIGDHGVKLSGGERQRLALARILLKKPRLLILDEATCQLDAKLEEQVYQQLSTLKDQMTIIMITHRQSTTHFADVVVELAHGKITHITSS